MVIPARVRVFIVLLIGSLLWHQSARAVDPRPSWRTVESAHFRFHYHEGERAIARRAAAIAEDVHARLTEEFNWWPDAKTEIVLSDETDLPNGMTTPVPFNTEILFVSPPRAPHALGDFDSWLQVLITHEYVHTLHLDKVRGAPSVFRKIFGRSSWFFPNAFQPSWLTEGLATWYETDPERGIGRGQSSIFAMMMRAEVADGIKPISQVNLPIRRWPVGATAYLYGVHFYQFAEARYGRSAIERYVHEYSNNLIPFRINGTAGGVFGEKFDRLWLEFERYLNERYRPQIESIRRRGVVEGRRLSDRGFRADSVRTLPTGETFYVHNNGHRKPDIYRVEAGGDMRQAGKAHQSAQIDAHPDAGILLVQPEVCQEYNFYYDLYRIAPGEDDADRLTRCGRYIAAAWNPDGNRIAAVRNKLGVSRLDLLAADGTRLRTAWNGTEDEILASLDWLPEGGAVIASIWRDGRWNLEQFDLDAQTWTPLTDDAHVQAQPQVTADGRYVYYTDDRTGVHNIWRINLQTGAREQITDVLGGAFSPAYNAADNKLYYIGYRARGYDLYALTGPRALETIAADDAVPARGSSPIDSAPAQTRDTAVSEPRAYSPWPTLRPRWWQPYSVGGEDALAIGATTGGNDALRLHSYSAGVAWELYSETPAGFLSYVYNNRFGASYSRDLDVYLIDDGDDDTVDDEVALARARDVFNLQYVLPFTRYDYRWQLAFGASRDREHDVERADFVISEPETEDNLLGAAIVFDNAERYNFSISRSHGRHLRLIHEDGDALDSDYPGAITTLDWREFVPLGAEHVLALRAVQGRGDEDSKPFQLGGEAGIFERDNLFNRRDYALRGYSDDLASLEGQHMRLGTVEYRFPISRIERTWMAPPLGLSQLSGAVFYEGGVTWNEGQSPGDYRRSAGIEVMAELAVFYNYGLQLKVGLASGLDEGGEDRGYLSLGASF